MKHCKSSFNLATNFPADQTEEFKVPAAVCVFLTPYVDQRHAPTECTMRTFIFRRAVQSRRIVCLWFFLSFIILVITAQWHLAKYRLLAVPSFPNCGAFLNTSKRLQVYVHPACKSGSEYPSCASFLSLYKPPSSTCGYRLCLSLWFCLIWALLVLNYKVLLPVFTILDAF